MQFTPKTDKELNNIALFQPGIYDFVVMDANELLDKNGNQMIKLTLRIDEL